MEALERVREQVKAVHAAIWEAKARSRSVIVAFTAAGLGTRAIQEMLPKIPKPTMDRSEWPEWLEHEEGAVASNSLAAEAQEREAAE